MKTRINHLSVMPEKPKQHKSQQAEGPSSNAIKPRCKGTGLRRPSTGPRAAPELQAEQRSSRKPKAETLKTTAKIALKEV